MNIFSFCSLSNIYLIIVSNYYWFNNYHYNNGVLNFINSFLLYFTKSSFVGLLKYNDLLYDIVLVLYLDMNNAI